MYHHKKGASFNSCMCYQCWEKHDRISRPEYWKKIDNPIKGKGFTQLILESMNLENNNKVN